MLETPKVVTVPERDTAVIRLTIERAKMGESFPPAIQEVVSGLAAQGISPAGPLFARYLRMNSSDVDVELGFPVEQPVTPSGRITGSVLPGGKVLRAVHRGPYEGLVSSWDEFGRWVAANGYAPDEGLWESYVLGPETNSDPTTWRTELILPLPAE